MNSFDVFIVGGGPAGSSMAWALRHSGLKVAIADRQSFPRDKTCAGWITPAIVGILALDLEDYRNGNTLQAINGFRTGTMSGNTVEIDYGHSPVSYGIRRCEFDYYLLQRSEADFLPGFNVRELEATRDGWLINGSIHTRLLVGAGGHFCPVARLQGAIPGNETAVRAREAEFMMTPSQARDCNARASVPEIYFCDDLKGYGWVFRKGDYLNIGLGRETPDALNRHVEGFCEHLLATGRAPGPVPDRFHGHAYVLYGHGSRPLYGEGLLLIGDAAGLADTRSGEGIRPAVESGLMAANVVQQCDGDYGERALQHYGDAITRRFGKRGNNRMTTGPGHWLTGPVRDRVAHRLLGNSWFTRHIVIGEWFLHRSRPV